MNVDWKYLPPPKGKPFKIGVGTEVVLAPKGNLARNNHSIRHGKVDKIGSKNFYVEVENCRAWVVTFRRQDFSFVDKGEINGSYEIFPSVEAYEDALQVEKKLHLIRAYFNSLPTMSELSVDGVNRIFGILLTEAGFCKMIPPHVLAALIAAEGEGSHD